MLTSSCTPLHRSRPIILTVLFIVVGVVLLDNISSVISSPDPKATRSKTSQLKIKTRGVDESLPQSNLHEQIKQKKEHLQALQDESTKLEDLLQKESLDEIEKNNYEAKKFMLDKKTIPQAESDLTQAESAARVKVEQFEAKRKKAQEKADNQAKLDEARAKVRNSEKAFQLAEQTYSKTKSKQDRVKMEAALRTKLDAQIGQKTLEWAGAKPEEQKKIDKALQGLQQKRDDMNRNWLSKWAHRNPGKMLSAKVITGGAVVGYLAKLGYEWLASPSGTNNAKTILPPLLSNQELLIRDQSKSLNRKPAKSSDTSKWTVWWVVGALLVVALLFAGGFILFSGGGGEQMEEEEEEERRHRGDKRRIKKKRHRHRV